MRPKSGAFSRRRPRVLTFVVLIAVAAQVVLANSSRDEAMPRVTPGLSPNPSYGWPLIWYWCEFKATPVGAPTQMNLARLLQSHLVTRPAPPAGAPFRTNLELVRWSGLRLAANLAIWLAMLAVVGVACQWLLWRYGPPWRFRPRLVTLFVLIAVAAPVVLANLSPGDVVRYIAYFEWAYMPVEYGWPLSWYWRAVFVKPPAAQAAWHVVHYSWHRLAGNLAIGFVILTAAGVACQWLLRRYRPRLRWNLKTMLAAVGLGAIFCAWCAALRDRADVQDPLIAEIEKRSGDGVYLDRWGPKWLDLVGADRFRRRIVGASPLFPRPQGASPFSPEIDADELFRRLGRSPDLRYLALTPLIDEWTPGMTAALGDMRQLRILVFRADGWPDNEKSERLLNEVLAAIGKLNQLEVLSFEAPCTSGGLAHLAGLTNLKSLRIDNGFDFDKYYKDDYSKKDEAELEHLAGIDRLPLLAHLPALPRLEAICLARGLFRERDARQLALLPCLRSLDLGVTFVTDAAWGELASLGSLEELAIEDVDSEAACESLPTLKRLKALHIANDYDSDVEEGEVDPCRRALEALRQSNPGIVIDGEAPSFEKRFVWRGRCFDASPGPADRRPPGTGFF